MNSTRYVRRSATSSKAITGVLILALAAIYPLGRLLWAWSWNDREINPNCNSTYQDCRMYNPGWGDFSSASVVEQIVYCALAAVAVFAVIVVPISIVQGFKNLKRWILFKQVEVRCMNEQCSCVEHARHKRTEPSSIDMGGHVALKQPASSTT